MYNTKYFANCTTIEEAKALYKKLAKANHPDLGGDTETMKAINAEFEKVFDLLKNKHTGANNTTYTAKSDSTETAAEFMNIINKLIHCNGLVIELVGRWIWLTGNTYEHRNIIKSLGFTWATRKKAWYWHAPEDKSFNRKEMSLNEIRSLYGSKVFETEKDNTARLTA